jgi:hypothetical protein
MFRVILSVILTCFIFSCNPGNENAAAVKPGTEMTGKEETSEKPTKESPYELHGILDPGMNNMVAFAIQTPTGWPIQQSFTRKWNGSTPINQVYIKMISPDQANVIELLPYSPYFYSDGPMARQMRASAAQMGVSLPPQPYEMAPVQPIVYIKKILLPQLAQNGIQINITGENDLPTKQEQQQSVYTGYVDGQTADGTKLRIDCIVSITTTNLNGEVYYNWNAMPSIVQSKTGIEPVYAHVTQARRSLMMNPAWEGENAQIVQKGNRINQDINKKNADIVKDYQDHTQRIIDETHQERNASADRRNEAFGDAIRGETKYENSESGQRVKLLDQYNHVYQDKQGNFYGSQTAIDKSAFDWNELQRVELKKY